LFAASELNRKFKNSVQLSERKSESAADTREPAMAMKAVFSDKAIERFVVSDIQLRGFIEYMKLNRAHVFPTKRQSNNTLSEHSKEKEKPTKAEFAFTLTVSFALNQSEAAQRVVMSRFRIDSEMLSSTFSDLLAVE
jgi:hypothetical protein